MLCRRAEMLPIECIVRGYLSGSAWKEYRATGTMHGTPLPAGLQESDQLPEPVFTPSTKAESATTTRTSPSTPRSTSSARSWPSGHATSPSSCTGGARSGRPSAASSSPTRSSSSGLVDGELVVCDEVLTPDSSRFWPADRVEAGRARRRVRQATGPRLPRRPRLGQDAAAPAAARRGGRRDRRPLRRGLRAHHRPVARRLARVVVVGLVTRPRRTAPGRALKNFANHTTANPAMLARLIDNGEPHRSSAKATNTVDTASPSSVIAQNGTTSPQNRFLVFFPHVQ